MTDLRKAQLLQLKIAKEIQRVCEENHIPVFIRKPQEKNKYPAGFSPRKSPAGLLSIVLCPDSIFPQLAPKRGTADAKSFGCVALMVMAGCKGLRNNTLFVLLTRED